MKFAAASLLALSALGAIASPIERDAAPFTVTVTKDLTKSKQGIAGRDQARWSDAIKSYNAGELKKRVNVPATNIVDTYTVSTKVGTGSNTYNLIVDTGSSNTWVGAQSNKRYQKTGKDTGETVSVSYGSGSFSGEEYIDSVILGSLTVKNQGIGAASTATGFTGVDGILGVGPADLTDGTTSGGEEIPTVVDNAKSQGTIPNAILGVYFAPTTSTSSQNGELAFGAPDTAKYSGSITYVPVTSTSPASYYWGIDSTLGYSTTTYGTTSGIVDTGTTLILIATDYFNKFKSATGGTVDSTTGLLKIPSSKYSTLKNFTIKVGGTSFNLTPSQYIVPQSEVSYYGGTSGSYYAYIGDLGSTSGQGLDFIYGQKFLENYYSIFDTTNNRVGLAVRT